MPHALMAAALLLGDRAGQRSKVPLRLYPGGRQRYPPKIEDRIEPQYESLMAMAMAQQHPSGAVWNRCLNSRANAQRQDTSINNALESLHESLQPSSLDPLVSIADLRSALARDPPVSSSALCRRLGGIDRATLSPLAA